MGTDSTVVAAAPEPGMPPKTTAESLPLIMAAVCQETPGHVLAALAPGSPLASVLAPPEVLIQARALHECYGTPW